MTVLKFKTFYKIVRTMDIMIFVIRRKSFSVLLKIPYVKIQIKNEKNLYVGSFKFFPFTVQVGSNWYMDRGVRD